MIAPDLDLPSSETVRWSPHRKASVVNDDRRGAIRTGKLVVDLDACGASVDDRQVRLTNKEYSTLEQQSAPRSDAIDDFPNRVERVGEEAKQASTQPAKTFAPAKTSPAVVLLVDDDDFMREITTDILIGLGYEVLQAANGDAALKELNNGGIIDILLTDLVMNGMNGRELAQRARAVHPMIPIVFISGCADLVEAVADHHQYQLIKKPFRPGDLCAHIEAALRQPGTPVGRPDIPE
jgi:DNA-binding response OmpR family regulator